MKDFDRSSNLSMLKIMLKIDTESSVTQKNINKNWTLLNVSLFSMNIRGPYYFNVINTIANLIHINTTISPCWAVLIREALIGMILSSPQTM